MWFLLILILGIGALAFWMWKRPDPVKRDQANAAQHDLWLEQIEAQLNYAGRLVADGGQQNYERAYQMYTDLATQQDWPQAYTQMGLMQLHGQGRAKNQDNAVALLEKAFRLGSDEAAYQLGLMAEQMNNDAAQAEKALYWHRHAAALGHVEAQYRLNALAHAEDGLASQQHDEMLKRHAENGHAGSQYQLAQQLLFDAVPPKIADGMQALFKAAEQNYLPAIRQLYEFYRFGQFVQPHQQRALNYLKACIALGDQHLLPEYQRAVLMGLCDHDQRQRVLHDLLQQSKAQHLPSKALLGQAYFHGWHVPKNETLAFRYWSEAAQEKSPEALCAIAALYFEQHLVNPDPNKAFELYRVAQDCRDSFISQMGLGLCYLTGSGVNADLQQAHALIHQAAQQGWHFKVCTAADQDYAIGLFYSLPEYPLPERSKAIEAFQRAAAQGSDSALWMLYQIYAGQIFSGFEDHAQAQNYLKQTADAGHAGAQAVLGREYLQQELPQYKAMALHYLKKSAQQGNTEAQNSLGELYEQSAQDDEGRSVALAYYQQAAAQGHAEACSHLGKIYVYGQGTARDLQQAQRWLRQGRLMGHDGCKEQLQNIEDYLNQETAF